MLPSPTLDQQVATGFIRSNITTNEGGVIQEEYAVLYTRDRTETVNQVWMGLTAGCAVCHDHKYDPLSIREFYSMAAFFNNLNGPVMDGNISNPAPTITVPRAEDRPRFEGLAKELAAAKAKVDGRKAVAKGEFAAWLKTVDLTEFANKVPADGLVFHAPLQEQKGNTVAAVVSGKDRTVKFENGYDWSIARSNSRMSETSIALNRSVCRRGSRSVSEEQTAVLWLGWMTRTGSVGGTCGFKPTGSPRIS
jgi:hypothetical protein